MTNHDAIRFIDTKAKAMLQCFGQLRAIAPKFPGSMQPVFSEWSINREQYHTI